MRRRLFAVASAISLVLCAVVAALLIAARSGWAVPYFRWHGAGSVSTLVANGWELALLRLPDGAQPSSTVEIFSFPEPMLIPILAVAPVTWAVTRIGHYTRRNRADGRCGMCRYDLTGNTSGVCPECGTPVRGKPGATL